MRGSAAAAAALQLVPDLQARAREVRVRPAAGPAERHHADAANVQHHLLARQAGLEVAEFWKGVPSGGGFVWLVMHNDHREKYQKGKR